MPELPTEENLEEWEVLHLLTSLVEKSLVIYEEPSSLSGGHLADGEWGEARYRLLETVRQYARDRLVETGEAAPARERHLACFVQLALQAETHSEGPEQSKWLDRLETENDNLRAALEWSLANTAGETEAERICGRPGAL